MSDWKNQAIERVLVANRGEIALRIMRACRELGITTVAIYGPGEENAKHVRYADDAYRLPDTVGIPYLDGEAIVDIAKRAGADAVHPGYGFLSEKAEFAETVATAGLTFIGPDARTIGSMGDKVEARRIAIAAGVNPVPGTSDPVETADEAVAWADEHGYPVAVKAAGGGGGRGFRVARTAAELPEAFAGSRGEAERYFSNPVVYLERYLERPRHIEVQVFGDQHGNVVAFPERDCSIQRRHQKLVEESPSPAVSPEIRAALQLATTSLAHAVGYVGAGTVEFLLDEDGSFYFLEMNTRIQVEHTVTEMVTGIDLVAEQIRVAQGMPLSFGPDIAPIGWSIEARINAEDSTNQFAPAPGTLVSYREPSGFGVRVDSGFAQGETIPAAYDSLIAKLVVWGQDREQARHRLRRALDDFVIAGVPTTIPFHQKVAVHPVFIAGDVTTTFLVEYPEVLRSEAPSLALHDVSSPDSQSRVRTDLLVEVDGRRFAVVVTSPEESEALASGSRTTRTRRERAGRALGATAANGNDVVSAVQGTVIRVAVENGQTVVSGDLIGVVEAMKMENEITAHRAGVVTELSVAVGDSVAAGGRLATIADE